ncbi:MAG TPA: PAS domain-containing protein [Kiloniellaceae bacterium]
MASPASFILPEDAAPKIKALYDYWQSIRPNDLALPGRRHFDPLDIPELLPNIWMLDVKRDPLRFRFRLIGTEIVRFTGRDSTGQWLDEVYPGYAESDAFRWHCAVAEEAVPSYRKSSVISNLGRPHIEAERLYLPLAEDGAQVDIVLVMTLYSGNPPRTRQR